LCKKGKRFPRRERKLPRMLCVAGVDSLPRAPLLDPRVREDDGESVFVEGVGMPSFLVSMDAM